MVRNEHIAGRKCRPGGTDGFTLIELMTVMVIIVILLAMVVGGWQYARRKAMISRTKADLQQISNALEKYRMDYKLSWRAASTENTYPYPTIIGTDARELADTAVTNFLREGFTFLDAWGTNFIYEYDPGVAKESYQLWSTGGDESNPADRIDAGSG